MQKMRAKPVECFVNVPANALAWHDKGRRDWIGHSVKIEEDGFAPAYMIVDRISRLDDETYRLHLILPE